MKTYLQSALIFVRLQIFYATKENNVAQFKIKVEINEQLHCLKMF